MSDPIIPRLAYLDTAEIFELDATGSPIGQPVATLQARGDLSDRIGPLMAAAPDLLDALKVVNEFAIAAIGRLGLTDTNGICDAALDAIAKAEGR